MWINNCPKPLALCRKSRCLAVCRCFHIEVDDKSPASDMTRGFGTHTRGANSIQDWNIREQSASVFIYCWFVCFSLFFLCCHGRGRYMSTLSSSLLVFVSIQAERNENEAAELEKRERQQQQQRKTELVFIWLYRLVSQYIHTSIRIDY